MYKELQISVLRNGYELTIGKDLDLVFTSPEDLFNKLRDYFNDPAEVEDDYRQRPNARHFDEYYDPYQGELSREPAYTVSDRLDRELPRTEQVGTLATSQPSSFRNRIAGIIGR